MGLEEAKGKLVPRTAISRGGKRSITPPRSIAETEAHAVKHSETPLGLSTAVKRDAPGMRRGVTPPPGVTMDHRFSNHNAQLQTLDVGRAGQGTAGRKILPPASFAGEFATSGYDSSSLMMQHTKAANEITKDPAPDRSHHYGSEAIKAHMYAPSERGVASGQRRQISPPKAIADLPVSSAVRLNASVSPPKDVFGMPRQVTPPKASLSEENQFAKEFKSPMKLELRDPSGQGRQIVPPSGVETKGITDGNAFMERHVKAATELQKDAFTPSRSSNFSIEKLEQAEKQRNEPAAKVAEEKAEQKEEQSEEKASSSWF